MRDGRTRKTKRDADTEGIQAFLQNHRVTVVVVSGATAGEQFPLDADCLTLGRGPGVDWVLNDSTASRQHAAIDFLDDGFRIRDLGSTNGITVNGKPVQVAQLRHGDRFGIGGQELQLVIEEREETPNTYVLSSEV